MKLSENDTSSSSAYHSSAMLLEAPEDPFDAFHPLETMSINPLQISAPILSLLPRELRDIIYTDLIVAGDLGLLRTSKVVCQEMTQLLHNRGICRITHDNKLVVRKCHASTVQNLDIHLTMGRGTYQGLHSLKNFSGSTVCRQKCRITLEHDDSAFGSFPGLWRKISLYVLDHFRALVCFKVLTIEIGTLNFGFEVIPRFLRMVQDRLEGSLGECIWHGRGDPDHGAQYLEFHPRDHWEAQA